MKWWLKNMCWEHIYLWNDEMKQVSSMTQNKSSDHMDDDLHIFIKTIAFKKTYVIKKVVRSVQTIVSCVKWGSGRKTWKLIILSCGLHSAHYVLPKFPCGGTKIFLELSQFRRCPLLLKHERPNKLQQFLYNYMVQARVCQTTLTE